MIMRTSKPKVLPLVKREDVGGVGRIERVSDVTCVWAFL